MQMSWLIKCVVVCPGSVVGLIQINDKLWIITFDVTFFTLLFIMQKKALDKFPGSSGMDSRNWYISDMFSRFPNELNSAFKAYTYIYKHTTHALTMPHALRGSRGISDNLPRHSRFTKMTYIHTYTYLRSGSRGISENFPRHSQFTKMT
jgi:hypothetical protein